MHVSIIIPAYNASATIAATLQSVADQSHAGWEAVIVDDGSTDSTAAIAADFAARDPRFRLLRQPNGGVSAARNTALRHVKHDWLLFLDADDLILPAHLEKMTEVLSTDSTLDAVHCAWTSLTADDRCTPPCKAVATGDLFRILAVRWLFPIHACVARRSIVDAVGGFDETLRASEDWDLWQRVARAGARFGAVPELLALYRMREGSASNAAEHMLQGGLKVLERGFQADPRVPEPHPAYPEGLEDGEELQCERYYLAAYSAGLALAQCEDPLPLLDLAADGPCPPLDSFKAAEWLVHAALPVSGRPASEWTELWERLEPGAQAFLTEMEIRSGARGFARRAVRSSRYLLRIGMASMGEGLAWFAVLKLKTSRLRPGFTRRARGAMRRLKRVVKSAVEIFPRLDRRLRAVRRSFRIRRSREDFETLFTNHPDPWNYTNPYEQAKYEQTLDLLPNGEIADAIELACAEGHFTVQLAPRVGRLFATDISHTAVERTEARCTQFDNITYGQLDFMEEDPPGRYDLVVCSEVLYFAGSKERLRRVADRMARFLKPGGHLVMAHANVTVDEPDAPGFEWDHSFGAKTIGETFEAVEGLELRRELRTPLYRIHVFQSASDAIEPRSIILDRQPAPLPPEVEAQVLWHGAGDRFPILGYHRVASAGSAALAPYRVTPEAFEEQLRFLRDAGYESIELEMWRQWAQHGFSIPRRAVHITFDDGYRDFYDTAWPLLKQYGFTATVFLVSDRVGRTNDWDAAYGEVLPLMDWPMIRQLQREGVRFGSHTRTHQPLTSLSISEARRELRGSRAVLENELGAPVDAVTYPWGECDRKVQFIAGASGYRFGLTTAPGAAQRKDSPLALPRIDVAGGDSIETFAARLGGTCAKDEAQAA